MDIADNNLSSLVTIVYPTVADTLNVLATQVYNLSIW
jgi:hypothetical protein